MLQLDPAQLPQATRELRLQVREFLAQHMPKDHRLNSDFTSGYNPEFSQLLGAQGWLGMTWPQQYGGHQRSFLERYVVTEELLASGAPVTAHWISDRQTGPLLLKFGSEQQREKYLPEICAGRCFFSIGMSEPNAGSDLAAIRTTATPTEGGWLLNGTKLWSSGAHLNHFMIALVRTAPQSDNRHAGMSQFIIDLKSSDIDVRSIRNIVGNEDFSEVHFADTFVPATAMVGTEGNGWQQVTSELAFERSGPERFLSTFRVFAEFIRLFEHSPTTHEAAALGRITAHLMTLRHMSISVASMLEAGKIPGTEAALVKELGNTFEKLLPEICRLAAPLDVDKSRFDDAYRDSLLLSPSFTLRGGTREIMRGVIARGLGIR